MATRLRKLRVVEISPVGRGANRHARILMLKSEGSQMPKTAAPPVDQFIGSIGAALRAAIRGQTPEGVTLADEAAVVKYVDEQLVLAKSALLAKGDDAPADDEDEELPPDGGEDNPTDDEEEEEGMSKSATEAIAKAQKDADEATRRAAAAEARVQKMEDDRRQAETLAKAGQLLDGFPGGPTREELGGLLLRLDEAGTAVVSKLCAAGATAAQQAELTKELGSRGRPSSGPLSELDALAKEIQSSVAKSGAPSLTYAQAYDRALKARPDLYAASVTR